MPQGDKPANSDKRKRRDGTIEKGPEAQARSRGPVKKLNGGSKAMQSGRKVPFGPVGGLGRKTNLSRSS